MAMECARGTRAARRTWKVRASATRPSASPDDLRVKPGALAPLVRGRGLAQSDAFRAAQPCEGQVERNGDKEACERGPPSLEGYLRRVLCSQVYDVARESELDLLPRLSESVGNELWLKREDCQPVFSFKLRGAYNKMVRMDAEARKNGVVCSSAGNHAQGVAMAAAKLGCSAVICMPVTTPDIKVTNVKRLGAEVVLVGETYDECQAYAKQRGREDGRTFVHPFDDPDVIAGQGTVGMEILRQCGNRLPEAIFVPVGGGGLIAGIAAYVKAVRPEIKVIGVEPVGANAMALSLSKGERVYLDKVDGFADGVAVREVGEETFRVASSLLDGVVLVRNDEICAAIKDVFNDTRSVLEPAGALAVAGAKAYIQHAKCKGCRFVAIGSGANMNFDRLRYVSELADIGAHREVVLATTIPEERGSFLKFVDTAVGSELPVTEFRYRFAADMKATILYGVGIRTEVELSVLLQNLEEAGMTSTNLTNSEPAMEHLRYLVGGRARTFTGNVPDERLYVVQFPERAGALKRFLEAISPRWNITLFHYRATGNMKSSVLLGLQVPDADLEEFHAVTQQLDTLYSFSKIEGSTADAFHMSWVEPP
eukprot:CAMPEP_0183827810 /NCGR_PEP_ID=MMETSP0807_2-20130328/2444_1 /TAXON_ID=88271 /ORGANISM="Picocystis salinarum, Strain CCMP1897" /LENGTH=595 /DNA_ID=CAMNT_0026072983 /DNA_START=1 /DNA_END=1785 /DNA_ORIENTATION=+